jgi:hypothetical protein
MTRESGKRKKLLGQMGIHLCCPKKRAGHAPEGSGVPVGTEYYWYILADQNVKKVDANNYSTKMTSLNSSWRTSALIRIIGVQQIMHKKKKLITLLEESINKLKSDLKPEA